MERNIISKNTKHCESQKENMRSYIFMYTFLCSSDKNSMNEDEIMKKTKNREKEEKFGISRKGGKRETSQVYTVGIKIRLLSYIIRRGRRGKAFSPKRWKACKKMCGIKNKSDAVIWYSCDKTTNINTCYVDGYTDREAMGRRLRNKKTERYTKLWSHIFIKTRVSLFGCSTEWEHCYEGEGESRYECFILRGFLFLLFLVCYENYILFIYFQHTMRCVLLLCRLHGRERRRKNGAEYHGIMFLWMRNISLRTHLKI